MIGVRKMGSRRSGKAYTKKKNTIIEKLKAWSYSRLNDYRNCPLKAKLKHIDKKKEPSSPALENGLRVHKLAEKYVESATLRLPKELKNFKDEFKDIRTAIKKKEIKFFTEMKLAFNSKWIICDWFGDSAFCRMALDLVFFKIKDLTTVYVIDYKTGKIREENLEQLDLYAMGIFFKYPDVEKVICEFWYLDQDCEEAWVSIEYTRKKDLKRLTAHWKKETRAYLNDTKFAPRPNDKCRWCDFSKDKQGLCQY